MRLILAEKPSDARMIALAVGATRRGDGCLCGDGVVVTWAHGHLIEIAEPEKMNPAWGGPWRMEQLPLVPEKWEYVVSRSGRKQFNIIKGLLREADEVVCATDAGREGEHIFRLIYEMAGCRSPVKRLWISTKTEDSIRRAFGDLKPSALFDGLAASAKARSQADWVVGLTLTRAYTVHNGTLCTIGRVQTPTLAMVVDRQKAIEAFVPTPYYEVRIVLEPGFVARYVDGRGVRVADRQLAERIVRDIASVSSARVTSVETKDASKAPPQLFDLTSLQKEANKQWGYTAAETLALAQELYEGQLLSYPRTESRHLSHELVPTLPGILEALGGRFADAVSAAKEGCSRRVLGKAYVDDAKLTDHHALIPTNVPPPETLGPRAAHIYDLVCRRFMAIFLDPLVRSETVALFSIGTHAFRATGSTVKAPGWTVVLPSPPPERSEGDEQEEAGQGLPRLEAGATCSKRSEQLAACETSPPRPYTDGTLVDAMQGVGADLEDEQLAACMAMARAGLGTVPTRGEIIERLIRSGYLERERKALLPTPKGRALIEQVHPDLRNPALTAKWEQRLKAIESAGESVATFERDIADHVRAVLAHMVGTAALVVPPSSSGRPARGPRGRGRGGRSSRAVAGGATSGGPRRAVQELGACPLCKQGSVKMSEKAYGCSRWRDGCGLTIWRSVAGKTIPPELALELLAHGRTGVVSGFKSRAGEQFSSALELKDGKVRLASPAG